MFKLAPPNPRAGLLPPLARGLFQVRKPFETRLAQRLMPKRITAKSVEIDLTRCRSQAAMLNDELLLYLLDVTFCTCAGKLLARIPLLN